MASHRAHRNMALKTTIGGQVFEFDTPQEMAEFMRLMQGASAPAASSGSAQRFPPLGASAEEVEAWFAAQGKPGPQAIIQAPPREIARPAKPRRQIRVGAGEITPGQAVVLSRALGGLKNFCPDADARIEAAGGSGTVMVEVWTEMGVDKPLASEIIGRLKEADLMTGGYAQSSKTKIGQVVDILTQHGVTCTTSGTASWMKQNARRNSANHNSLWLRAY